jgi:hypothetical protein
VRRGSSDLRRTARIIAVRSQISEFQNSVRRHPCSISFLLGTKPILGRNWRFFLKFERSLSRYCEQRGKIMPTVPEIITESVIKHLEQGVAPWRKPWSTSIPRNLITKRPYHGLNVFMLATQGYGSESAGKRRRRRISGYISNVSTIIARVTFLNGLTGCFRLAHCDSS